MYSCQLNPLYGVILLFRQAVLLPVLLGGDTVLLFECPEKAGVVLEAVLEIHMADGVVGQYGVLAGVKPLFQDVLVERNAHVVLEYVGNMVFAHIEKGRQAVQTQILLQMPVDVVTDVQVQDILIDRGQMYSRPEASLREISWAPVESMTAVILESLIVISMVFPDRVKGGEQPTSHRKISM